MGLLSSAPSAGTAFGRDILIALGYAAFGGFALVLARIDLRCHTLPNGLVAAAALCLCGPLTVVSMGRGDHWCALLPWAASVAAALLAFICWASGAGFIGGGDVKLTPVAVYAGVWPFGPDGWLDGALVFGLVLAGMLVLSGLSAILRGRREFAAGPWLLAASGIAALLGALAER